MCSGNRGNTGSDGEARLSDARKQKRRRFEQQQQLYDGKDFDRHIVYASAMATEAAQAVMARRCQAKPGRSSGGALSSSWQLHYTIAAMLALVFSQHLHSQWGEREHKQ